MKNLEILLLSILVLFSLNNDNSSELLESYTDSFSDIEIANIGIDSVTGLTQIPKYSDIISTNIDSNSYIISTNIGSNSYIITTNIGSNSDIISTNIGLNTDIITTNITSNSEMISINIGSNLDIESYSDIGTFSNIKSTNIESYSDMVSTNIGTYSSIVSTDILTNSDIISNYIRYSDIVSTNLGSYLPQNNNTDAIESPKFILIGFENYNYNYTNKTINFKVLFQKISGNIYPVFLNITIHIKYGILRYLEEDVKTIKCPRVEEVEDNKITFFCSEKTGLYNIIKISADKNMLLIQNNKTTYDNVLKIFLSGYANRTIENLQNTKKDLKFVILQNSTVEYPDDKNQFSVKGFIPNKEFKDNKITLYTNENENEKIKEIPCILDNYDNNNFYYLNCTPKQYISFHIDNAYGTFPNEDRILIISMKNNDKDFIEIYPENEIENINKKAPNRGLSDGAIAGIVIGCVLTIFSIIIVIVLLRGRNVKSPPKLNCQLDMYSHVSKSSQQNIEEQ